MEEHINKEDILNNINGYSLDDYQRNVVLSNKKAILVVAGAGSGKSLTIIGKIVYLVKCLNVPLSSILCISLTNDATNNLKNNIKKNYNFDITVYTFHKLALEILKSHHITYDIADDSILDSVIDNFIANVIPTKKILLKTYKKLVNNKKEELNLKRLVKTFINLYKSNDYEIIYFKTILKKIKWTFSYKKYQQNKNLILLILNIYLMYQHELQENNLIDFNDMINKCKNIVKEKGIKSKWEYIIVDEYQDTSLTKFNLLKEIINDTNATFLGVGDDFQSIYRFTGCDLNIFLNFQKFFPEAEILKIINTYRNPQELINVAGSFVMQNKRQIKKKLVSFKHLENPIVLYYTNNNIKALKELLKKANGEIFVIGRNNKDIFKYIDTEYKKLEDSYYFYQDIKFRYLTAHKSKGLESDTVILINICNDMLGFPTKIKDEEILKYVNNNKDIFPFEEERRLFYVALTRTKNKVYIICNNESVFVSELKKYKKDVEIVKSK